MMQGVESVGTQEGFLRVEKLSKSFRKHFWSAQTPVLKELSFGLPQGTATGFLGANGSGKSTTFKCLLSLLKKDSGEVFFKAQPLQFEDFSQIGFLPEQPRFYEELTAQECLYFYIGLKAPLTTKLKDKIHEGLKKLDLYAYKDKALKTFSKGMLQKVGVLQSLIPSSELLILDEPFSGLDPESRFVVAELLEQELQQGTTLFLSSHIFQDVEKICDRLLLIKQGSLIFEGDFSSFRNKQSQARKKILYFLNDKKQSCICPSEKQAQEKLQSLLKQGAVILSLQSEGQNLEDQYKQIMKSHEKT